MEKENGEKLSTWKGDQQKLLQAEAQQTFSHLMSGI